MPRSRSCGRRSVLRPVSASTSVVLPWSMCPAVPIVSGMRWTLAAAVVLLLATIYELVLAFGAVGIGSVPGEGATGAAVVSIVALVAMAVGALRSPVRPSILLPPSAALFLLAFDYTYDPYFAPSKRRYLDGVVPVTYVLALLGVSLAVALLT